MTYNAGKLGSQEWWPAYNRSGSKIDAASIVKITDLKVVDDRFYLEVDECDSAANFILGVTGPQLDMASSAYGDVRPLGNVFYCKYDTGDGTPANEENWGADNGTSLLKKNFGGGQHAVIGSDSESELAVVMHTGVVQRWGKADADIAENATGTVSVYSGTGSKASWTDTGDDVTVRNIGINDITSDTFIELIYKGSEWTALPAAGLDASPVIRFSIIYAIPSEQYAVCLPISAPSGYTLGVDTNLPGADASGHITIYDRNGCFLDDNDAGVFIDRDGHAAYLQPLLTTECEGAYTDTGLSWEMISLCCDTTVCDGQ